MSAGASGKGLLLILLPMLLVLSGCDALKNTPVSLAGTPLPGTWYGERQGTLGENVTLHDRLLMQVSEEGYVSYFFLACESGHADGKTRVKRFNLHNMPIKRLTTVKMVLQTYPLTPKFQLSLGAWPDANNGKWVVDEIELQPVDAQVPDPGLWECQGVAE